MTPEFRAWDKKNEIYLYNVQYAYDTLSGFVKYDDDKNATYDESCFGDFLDNKRYDTEQFTGLKDVNGNKIFEGDIVRVCYIGDFDGENPHNQFVTSVEFNAPMFDLNQHHIPQEWALYSSLSALFDLFEDDDYEIEVIGNIHNNPELLEVEE